MLGWVAATGASSSGRHPPWTALQPNPPCRCGVLTPYTTDCPLIIPIVSTPNTIHCRISFHMFYTSVAAGEDVTTSPSPSLLPSPPFPPSSRRLPPPCWSHDEIVALIDAYRNKWLSLGRGSLRASHWDDVSSAVARCFSAAVSPKTSVQCRHKIEKLRKRHRSEKQRPVSSWLYFRHMDAMECDETLSLSVNGRAEAGLLFKIPKALRSKNAGPRPSPRASAKRGLEDMWRSVERKRRRMMSEEEQDDGAIGDVAAALAMIGDGFLRMEQKKMEVSREMEKMRMEMELKRTEMILDCQRHIVDFMVQIFLGKKKAKGSMQS